MSQEGTQTSDAEATLEKYKAGMQIILEGARIATGLTPREVIWTKNKARLYRYIPTCSKRYTVPLLLIYALITATQRFAQSCGQRTQAPGGRADEHGSLPIVRLARL